MKYLPIPVQVVLLPVRFPNANVVLRANHLLHEDIPRAGRHLQQLLVSVAAGVNLARHVALDDGAAVLATPTHAALVHGGVGIDDPVAAHPPAQPTDAHVVGAHVAGRPVRGAVPERHDDGVLRVGAVQLARFVCTGENERKLEIS